MLYEECACSFVSMVCSEWSRDLLCAVLFDEMLICEVLGVCSGIWFSGVLRVVLCPGIACGISGVFIGGRVGFCWYVYWCVFVCSM